MKGRRRVSKANLKGGHAISARWFNESGKSLYWWCILGDVNSQLRAKPSTHEKTTHFPDEQPMPPAKGMSVQSVRRSYQP